MYVQRLAKPLDVHNRLSVAETTIISLCKTHPTIAVNYIEIHLTQPSVVLESQEDNYERVLERG